MHQAAELFSGLENRARETEARAHSLCKNALERLELAEKRIETVERERHETINEAHGDQLTADQPADNRAKDRQCPCLSACLAFET